MNNLLRTLMLGGSSIGLTVWPHGAAFAQDQSDIEQVVVSASRITIAGYSQTTPVTVVSEVQIARDAYSNIADSIRQLPQVTSPPSSYSTAQTQVSMGTAGTNFVNLRDLGATRTLVLLDGQRLVPATINGGVDITTLPRTLVSRVDIVTGGASAAWGSDAVAGVTNFVLNKNFTGFQATLQGGDTSNNLVRDAFAEAAWGGDMLDGRGHFELAASADLRPDVELLTDANWFRGAYWVSNPAFVAGNGQPQLIIANNVGLATATAGGLITASPAGAGANGAAANALRGIQFAGAVIPQLVNFGNLTLGTLSNGGSLTQRDGQQALSTIAEPSNSYSLFGYGRYRLTETVQASIELSYGYVTGKGMNPPTVQTALTIKSDNAFIPASVRAAMQAGGITSFTLGTLSINNYNLATATGASYYSQAEASLSLGVAFDRRNSYRGVFALNGTLGNDWSWKAYIQHGAVRFSSNVTGIPITANLTAAEDAITVTAANLPKGSTLPLGSLVCRSTLTGQAVTVSNVTAQSGCIPLDVFGIGVASPAAIAYATGASTNSTDIDHQSMQQDVAEASMQGTLPWDLPAGKIAVAFGAGYRKESGFAVTTPIAILSGYGGGNPSAMPSSSYNVLEGFAEADVPVLKDSIVNSLELNLAGRMTGYSTSGLVETWKLGATSQVNDDIKLRTTWSVDIRAPQLSDLFSSGSSGNGMFRDPKTQFTGPAINLTAGNPNLLPEVARTISGGVVLTPAIVPGLSLSADWYHINLTSEITSVNAMTIVNQCNPQLASVIYPGQNGNPNDPLCTHLVFNGPGGALSQINNPELNFASQTVSGMDLEADYAMDFLEGTLHWATKANYTDENTLTQPGLGVNDSAGSNAGNAQTGPKWRGILAATYTTGPLSVTAQSRWFGTSMSYQNGNTGNQASAATANLYDPAHFEVPFNAYLDLRSAYKWNDNISLFGAIDNALNTPPPLVAPTSSTVQAPATFYGTNANVYDLLGRVVRVGLRFAY
jgi:iron complex outermembrane receptor protein